MGAWETAFAGIWDKATGGRTVAVDPHLEDMADAFSVDPAPGVGEASEWLRAAVVTGMVPRMVFLVGGPGGGKSHAIRRVTADLEEVDSEDTGLAQRTYRFRSGDAALTVVNDASIRSGDDRHPLADDINRAIGDGDSFLGCVNRGILVEEAYSLSEDTPGANTVRWLAGAAMLDSQFPLLQDAHSPIVSRAELHVGEQRIQIVAVFVDHCSLLEMRPSVDDALVPESYKVLRLKRRAEVDSAKMPAGALMGRVLDHLTAVEPTEQTAGDPVRANAASLRSPAVQAGVLTVLRSAEAVAGSRMAFREVWGAVVRCLLGDLPQQVQPEALEHLFPELDESAPARERFDVLRDRARYRLGEALFGIGASSDVLVDDPVLRLTSGVDPVLDAVAGRLSQGGFGWATPVVDAFTGLITAVSPLQLVIESVSETDPFLSAVTQFDWSLDRAFVEITQPEGISDHERRDIVAWYGDYLSRLYAVSNGVSAYRQEFASWLDTRTVATLPSGLERDLKTLLRPSRDASDPQSGYVLPLFNSRTAPLTGPSAEPQLVLKGEDSVQLKVVPRGDAVSVQMIELGAVVGEIELDFALIRTALACSNQRLGVTEQAARVSPRVERFRAKRLVPDRVGQSDLRLLVGRDMTDVYVEG